MAFKIVKDKFLRERIQAKFYEWLDVLKDVREELLGEAIRGLLQENDMPTTLYRKRIEEIESGVSDSFKDLVYAMLMSHCVFKIGNDERYVFPCGGNIHEKAAGIRRDIGKYINNDVLRKKGNIEKLIKSGYPTDYLAHALRGIIDTIHDLAAISVILDVPIYIHACPVEYDL